MNTQHTNNARWQAVSAAMDGETQPSENWDWLDDEVACSRWHTYHIIRDSMRQSANQHAGGGLKPETLAELSRLLQQSEQEARTSTLPLSAAAPAAANQPFFKWFATAASVLALTVVGWQLWASQQQHNGTMTTQVAPSTKSAPVAPTAATADVVVPVAAAAASAPAEAVPMTEAGRESDEGVVLPAVQKQGPAAALEPAQ